MHRQRAYIYKDEKHDKSFSLSLNNPKKYARFPTNDELYGRIQISDELREWLAESFAIVLHEERIGKVTSRFTAPPAVLEELGEIEGMIAAIEG